MPGSPLKTPAFLDNGEFFMAQGNAIQMNWPNVSDAFSTPVAMASSSFTGWDWTRPWPGGDPIDGHSVHLTVAPDVLTDPTVVVDAATVLSSLTFSIPDDMMSGGKALPMDPSWYICRHVFITTKPEAKESADGGDGCGFLQQGCLDDLGPLLSDGWGTTDNNTMCAQLIFDPMPESCRSSFGYARQDSWYADSTVIANPVLGPLETIPDQQHYTWRIGTGYHSPGDPIAYEIAANRTYLVATVWGYSKNVDASKKKTPQVTWTCISSGDAYVPPPPPTSIPTAVPNTDAYYDDFTSGLRQWTTYDGSFSSGSGVLTADYSLGGKALLKSSYSNFTFEADVTLSNDWGNAGLIFRVSSPGDGADTYKGYYAGISTENNVVLGRASNDWTEISLVDTDIAVNKAHHLKVKVRENKIDVYVNDMTKAKISATDITYSTGMDGVRVFDTGATFDNVQIFPLAFKDDFASGSMDKWATYGGDYATKNAALVGQASSGGKALIRDALYTDFVYEADVTIWDESGDAGLVFRASSPYDKTDGYYGYYAGFGNGYIVFGRSDNGWNELANVKASIQHGTAHHIMVRARGNALSIFVDDMNEPKIETGDDTYLTGLNGVRVSGTKTTFDNVIIYTM
ncbi:carbohydrate-binding module family 66 protein [Trichoderma citrinoviride]|uniref:Carbohydrate-binding module family 66 protein n=1 Tax=Trichoderma citrinoviride TaxID=58853 RepID=A0A2T4B338_9HYPO|nr:carbohydrate-binding module family 66 protein [Trichoderma citrinoviride]PTB63753.1 carbohydrate-binding module family 66 protein [Trichoderma citrinoviride]